MRRSKQVSPWHNCTLCGIKTHISDMGWQQGVFKCKRTTCWDSIVLGQRDADIARALNDGANLKEMQPAGELSEPAISAPDEINF